MYLKRNYPKMYFPSRYAAGRTLAPRIDGVAWYLFEIKLNTYQRAPPYQRTLKSRQSKMQTRSQANSNQMVKKVKRSEPKRSSSYDPTSSIQQPCTRMTSLRHLESWLEISAREATQVILALLTKTVLEYRQHEDSKTI